MQSKQFKLQMNCIIWRLTQYVLLSLEVYLYSPYRKQNDNRETLNYTKELCIESV